MSKKFWTWSKNEDSGERILRLDGVIHDWTWIDEWLDDGLDDVLNTPKEFRQELNSAEGDIVLYINSPGGNTFSAAEIYAMLKEYSGGKITAKIPGYAASSATIIAMAADAIEISPLAFMMIHNPWLDGVVGEEKDMERATKYLADLKENIISAYEAKTKLPRQQISDLMDAETYMNAKKAVELHFADKFMFDENQNTENLQAEMFSNRLVSNSLARRLNTEEKQLIKNKSSTIKQFDAKSFYDRLKLIAH